MTIPMSPVSVSAVVEASASTGRTISGMEMGGAALAPGLAIESSAMETSMDGSGAALGRPQSSRGTTFMIKLARRWGIRE